MCGLSGIISQHALSSSCKDSLVESIKSIAHRGPDANNTHFTPQCYLGHARLSVLDLNERSNQPFLSPDGNYSLVFNGEIYNFKTLRDELIALGHSFSTESDTEVVLYGLMEFGTAFIDQMEGCFAFAFYDEQSQELAIARDRMGINPLWYWFENETLVFSSEGKGIFPFLDRIEINQDELKNYFSCGYVDAPNSLIKGLKKVLPGQLILFKKGKLSFHQYFELRKQSIAKGKRDTTLEELLTDAVQKRLVADVPLGTFLSGGLDSSLISAMATQAGAQLNTFNISFKDQHFFDERIHAEAVAKHIGSNHHTLEVSSDDLLQEASTLGKHLDEPFGDSSVLPMRFLCESTAKLATVALSGDGADELFAGYEKHRAHLIHENAVARLLAGAEGILPEGHRNSKTGNLLRKVKRMAASMNLESEELYQHLRSFSSPSTVQSWFNAHDWKPQQFVLPNLQEVLYLDQLLVLPNDMLTKVDSMSMKHHLEVRTPFLDQHVVAFANALEPQQKFGLMKGKTILRQLAEKYLPESIIKRPKRGFEIPLEEFLKGALKSSFERHLESGFLEELQLNKSAITEDWKHFLQGDSSKVSSFWFLFVLFEWMNEHLK